MSAAGVESLTLSMLVFISHHWLVEAIMQGRCLLHNGQCVDSCPPNMYPYHTRCDADTMSQRTCAYPDPFLLGFTCGWSRCDCMGDLVYQEYYGCVQLADCEVRKLPKDPSRPNKKRRRRKGSRIKFPPKDISDWRGMLPPVPEHIDEVDYVPPGPDAAGQGIAYRVADQPVRTQDIAYAPQIPTGSLIDEPLG